MPGLQARLDPSGHMLGSAFVKIDDGRRSILFSGDIGRPNDLVLAAPTRVPGADYAVVESTYGDRQHEASDPLLKLGEVINRTAARGGVVVIPAFAVGRAQTLMYCIHLLKQRGAKKVYAYCTHPIFSGPAIERIAKGSALDEVVVTNTIPLSAAAAACPKIRQLSVAPLIAQTIQRIARGESVMRLFQEQENLF